MVSGKQAFAMLLIQPGRAHYYMSIMKEVHSKMCSNDESDVYGGVSFLCQDTSCSPLTEAN